MSDVITSTYSTIRDNDSTKVAVSRDGVFEITFGGMFSSNLTLELSRRAARAMATNLTNAIAKFDATQDEPNPDQRELVGGDVDGEPDRLPSGSK
ncbi:MAG: hypothetical protein M3443_06440 [Actinomycetota bacterium]|nr:hypothetical protein [Actinomycetota bacterium]